MATWLKISLSLLRLMGHTGSKKVITQLPSQTLGRIKSSILKQKPLSFSRKHDPNIPRDVSLQEFRPTYIHFTESPS